MVLHLGVVTEISSYFQEWEKKSLITKAGICGGIFVSVRLDSTKKKNYLKISVDGADVIFN